MQDRNTDTHPPHGGVLYAQNEGGVNQIVVRELLIALGFQLDQSKLKQADAGLNRFKSTAEATIGVLGRMAAVLGVALGAGEIIKIGDAWTNVNSRIGLVTKSAAEQAEIQEKVYDIAQKTRQEYTATGDLYFKLARASSQLGASQQDVLDVTETVNKALVVGGASTQEAQATILQLSQALASGRLQGDELRSLGENASVLMDEVARYYGVTVGELKEMGKNGELTAEGVFKAILKAKDKLDKEFAKMPVTIEQAVTYSLNRIGRLIFGLNKETNVFQHIAKKIMAATDGIAGRIENGIKVVGGWSKAIRYAALAVTSLSLTMLIFNNKLITFSRWIALFRLLRISILAANKAAWAMVLNPLFWKAALIAAGIALIALGLEDLYHWITGGDSVLGTWLGTWESFKGKVIGWIDEMKVSLEGFIDKIIEAMGLKEKFDRMNKAVQDNPEILNIPLGNDPNGYSIPPDRLAQNQSSTVIVNINGDTNIEQNIAGTGQQLANNVGAATANATNDALGGLVRGLEFYPYPTI